jgi:hypothetical protein
VARPPHFLPRGGWSHPLQPIWGWSNHLHGQGGGPAPPKAPPKKKVWVLAFWDWPNHPQGPGAGFGHPYGHSKPERVPCEHHLVAQPVQKPDRRTQQPVVHVPPVKHPHAQTVVHQDLVVTLFGEIQSADGQHDLMVLVVAVDEVWPSRYSCSTSTPKTHIYFFWLLGVAGPPPWPWGWFDHPQTSRGSGSHPLAKNGVAGATPLGQATP